MNNAIINITYKSLCLLDKYLQVEQLDHLLSACSYL